MKRILERHDDVGTMGIVLYESEGNQLFFDEECTEGVTREELAKIAFHPLIVIPFDRPDCVSRLVEVNSSGVVAYVGGNDHSIYCSDAMVLD